MEAALCTELDLAPSVCSLYPPSTELVCSPTVICGQWRVGQPLIADETGWGPVTCTPLDLDPIVCVEA